ncbi:unnamed protein product [Cylindrotheca closterium]|uniref:Uncharacterized protein n=1 Tax=Cylindrotheca closterium TaxID=2856 RepID=A0AAD2PUL2_9STRA|nr:unnamed protein product [Cylindrotheca closterium]
MSNEEPPTKRRRSDALGRLLGNGRQCPASTSPVNTPFSTPNQSTKLSSLSGRGSLDGWTTCPLCGKYSKKKYAFGKGIASHLLAIHTPWNPTKLSLKIERRKKEEQERQDRRKHQQSQKYEKSIESSNGNPGFDGNEDLITRESNTKVPKLSAAPPTAPWTPNDAEREAWDAKVLRILSELEHQHVLLDENKKTGPSHSAKEHKAVRSRMLTKTGSQTTCYRDSLPAFLDAASKGDLDVLQQMVAETSKSKIQKLLDTKDRHLSTAEHWAAGGGHFECLEYLRMLRRRHAGTKDNDQADSKRRSLNGGNESSDQAPPKHKLRRRDGKTSLHYAARNGHLNCVKYLIEKEGYQVEEASGEGTLPLHMACFGGHLPVVQYLVEQGADVHARNEWGCDAFQFVGLTISKPTSKEMASTRDDTATVTNTTKIRDLCNYLRHACKVNLIRSQQQGHSILHKAAQKGNWHVLQWVADAKEAGGAGLSKEELTQIGAPDLGGHRPSHIWRKFHADESVAMWMESLGW